MLPFGMNNMAIKGLQGKDICDIIKACAKAGVSEFEVGDFRVKFGNPIEQVGTQAPNEGTHSTPPQSGKTENNNMTPEQQMDVLQKRAIEELAQTQTLIDDPSQFENDLVDDMIFGKGDSNDSEERRRVRAAL